MPRNSDPGVGSGSFHGVSDGIFKEALWFQNVRSLRSNHFKLKDHVSQLKHLPIAIACQEVWKPHSSQLFLPNYQTCTTFERPGNNNVGGGVGIFVKQGISYQKICTHAFKPHTFEAQFIYLPLFKTVVGNVYKPPQTPTDTFMQEMKTSLDEIKAQVPNCDIVIGGDFNINFLSAESIDFVEFMDNQGLRQLIRQPTRVTSSCTTLIDNIFTTAQTFHDCGVVATDISDHFGTFFRFIDPKETQSKHTINTRSTKPENIRRLKNLLSEVSWEALNHLDNPTKKFYEIFNSAFDLACPISSKKPNRNSIRYEPWMTQGLMISRKRKNKLIHSKTLSTETKKYRNIYNRLVRTAKKLHFINLMKSNFRNPKKIWEETNAFINRDKKRDRCISELNTDSGLTSCPKKMAMTLNEYFNKIGSSLANKINKGKNSHLEFLNNPKSTKFSFHPVTKTEIGKIVSNMDAKNSTGIDNLSNKIMKEIWPQISTAITIIINDCLTREYFPQEWKTAKICAIYKKGDPTDKNNYRPIALLCCLSKVLEKCVDTQVRSYMNRHGYFYTHQYGFRAGYQCPHAILKFCSEILESRNIKAPIVSLFLDIRKAFDSMSFNILFDKLEYYGIPPKFFKSYLTNRMHFTEVQGARSTKARQKIGVPQGSVLGPLLFTIFMNDIQGVSTMTKVLYADDTVLLKSSNDITSLERMCNSQLELVSAWYIKNGLTLAAEKTTYMLFNSGGPINIYIQGEQLKQVENFKYLGVIIDSKLNWKSHINSVCTKVKQNSFLLAKVKYILPPRLKLWLYNAIVKPYIDYSCTVWGFGNINSLLQCQKKAIRYIHGSKNPRCHTNQLFLKYNVMKVDDIIKYSSACLMHDFRTKRIPFGLSPLFQYKISPCETRTQSLKPLHVPTYRQEWRRKTIFYQGPQIWNSLEDEIKKLGLPKTFKEHCKSKLIKTYADIPQCRLKGCISCV
jgi:hypothetical protein